MDLQIQQNEGRPGIFLKNPQCFEAKSSNHGRSKFMLISKNFTSAKVIPTFLWTPLLPTSFSESLTFLDIT